MKRIWLAATICPTMLLAACGSGSQAPAPAETPTAAETAMPETSPSATEEASPAPEASAMPGPAAMGGMHSGMPSGMPGAMASAAPAPAASTATAVAAAAEAPAAFNQCKACHSTEPGKNGIGPSLAGIYGTKAGEVAGYDFSDAMKNSGLTWDAATLDKYLTKPMEVVPGTKMSFGGLKDADKRKAVIDYLKSLK